MPRPLDILVVDDNPDALQIVRAEMRSAGYQVRVATDGISGWSAFRSRRPDLVISDIRMPVETGIDLLRRIREVSDLPVILLTAQAEVSLAISALRGGATDLVRFPEDMSDLRARVRQLLPDRDLGEPEDAALVWLPGDAPAIRQVRARLRALAPLDVPVLLSGEPGTGRAAAARALHGLAGNDVPLQEVHPSAPEIPPDAPALMLVSPESWPRAAQDAWASALRPGNGSRLGRIFTISTPTLAARVDRLEFRRDLWLRLSRFRIDLPPLRERAQDIPALVRKAIAESTAALGRPELPITPGAIASLQRRPWPGNLPELSETVVQAVAFAGRGRIDREEVDRALEAVIAAREDSLSSRRAERKRSERDELVALLGACGGNVAEIARRLGMTRGAVAYRLRKHGLTP